MDIDFHTATELVGPENHYYRRLEVSWQYWLHCNGSCDQCNTSGHLNPHAQSVCITHHSVRCSSSI